MWIIKQNTSGKKGCPTRRKAENRNEKPHLKRIFFHYINFIFILIFILYLLYNIFSQLRSDRTAGSFLKLQNPYSTTLNCIWAAAHPARIWSAGAAAIDRMCFNGFLMDSIRYLMHSSHTHTHAELKWKASCIVVRKRRKAARTHWQLVKINDQHSRRFGSAWSGAASAT